MDIVIISQFGSDFSTTDNDRFIYLAKLLAKAGHRVELVTSDFEHAKKRHRIKAKADWPFRITFIHETGYPKNVCLKRFYSHYVFGQNLIAYLKERSKPDVVYCAVPSLTGPELVADYCTANEIRFIVDVQDLWPEAFQMVFDPPVISGIFYTPFSVLANKVYAAADEIVAVSKTYAERAFRVNHKSQKYHVAFLGTDMAEFDSYSADSPDFFIGEEDSFKVVYVGTLANSYDLENVIVAAAKVQEEKIPVKLIIMGDGEKTESLREQADQAGVNCLFTGRLPYSKMAGLLAQCDVAVNPIKHGSAGSIINKVGDYAMAGLPVVNTQECIEYRDLLEKYQAGINCECENSREIVAAIVRLYRDSNLRDEMSRGSRKLGVECFSREVTYSNLIRELGLA